MAPPERERGKRMAAYNVFNWGDFADTLISLVGAFVLGAIIGAERQYRQRSGGLRTNALVAVGAATFVDIGMHLNGAPGATQIIAYVVSGVGFLGAGVIMKEGGNVWGLNTAATLWCSAAVGACAGADLAAEAVLLTMFVLAGNTLLRPLVNAINRTPMDERQTEAIYEVRATANVEHLEEVRQLLQETLEAANYPVREIKEMARDGGEVELAAYLVSTAVEPGELEQVVRRLERAANIQHTDWTLRTAE
jgi:putative Mg2+ transporter-C (MgtC) family protein